jgi:RHS repeat-associated protein
MKKDDEVKGEGNSLDFGERMLDTRIGRWFKTDKVNKPWLSPYQFADNNPVNNVDADGNDEIHFYYKTQQMLDKDGKAHTQLTLSSEIIKNNSEHTFFMHSPQGATVEFHPFKSDRTPNETSTEAYDNKLPLSKSVDGLFGLITIPVDDNAYLGTLLQAAPEVMEHYSDIREDGMRFRGAVNRASSVDFAETVIRAEETMFAIVDGYYLIKGLSKFAVKELAKNSLKIAETNVNSVVQSTSRVTFNPKALYAKYAERHIFSAKHLKNGILDLGTKKEILHNATKTINEKMSLLKEGENYIYTKINGKSATISASVENGAVRSVNVVKGEQIARDATKVNVIK